MQRLILRSVAFILAIARNEGPLAQQRNSLLPIAKAIVIAISFLVGLFFALMASFYGSSSGELFYQLWSYAFGFVFANSILFNSLNIKKGLFDTFFSLAVLLVPLFIFYNLDDPKVGYYILACIFVQAVLSLKKKDSKHIDMTPSN